MRTAQRAWISVKDMKKCLEGLENDLFLFVNDVHNLGIVTYDKDLMIGYIDIAADKIVIWDPSMDGKF